MNEEKKRQIIFVDPRTKLFLLFILNIIMINAVSTGIYVYLKLIVALIPFILLLSCDRKKQACMYLGIFSFCWVSCEYIVPSTTGGVAIVLGFVSSMGSRFYPGAMMGYYFFSSTKVNEFVAALEKMHISQKIIIPFSVMFRFFPTIMEEVAGISDAMKIRNIGLKSFFTNPVKILEYRLVPLMTSVVNIGNELSASALTRCLGSEKARSNISRSGFGMVDAILFLVGGIVGMIGFFEERGII